MKNLITCSVLMLLAAQTVQAQSNRKTTQSNQESRQSVPTDSIRQSADTTQTRQRESPANRQNMSVQDSTRSTSSDSTRNMMLTDSSNAVGQKSAGTMENTTQSSPESRQTGQKMEMDSTAKARQNKPIEDGAPAPTNELQSAPKTDSNSTKDTLNTPAGKDKTTTKPMGNKKGKQPKN